MFDWRGNLTQERGMDSPETEGVNSLKPLRRQGMCPLLASVGGTLSRLLS